MRSLLYVPGNRGNMLARAGERGADAVIIDLEDSVPVPEKALARDMLQDSVPGIGRAGAKVFVRINSQWSAAWRDIEAAVAAGAEGLVLPKVRSAGQLAVIAEFLGELDPAGTVGVLALVEDAVGLQASGRIAAATPRLRGLIPGNQDLALQFGITPSTESMARLILPLQIAAAAAGIALYGSIGGSASFRDPAAWRTTVKHTRAAGFDGVTCIHPSQVTVVNEVFTPTDAELEDARRVVAGFEAGGGQAVEVDGVMVDLPVYERAKRLMQS